MSVHYWIGQTYEFTQERRAIVDFLKMMQDALGASKEPYYVLANFYLHSTQIDLTVLKRDAIIVIDFKEYSEPFHATENGPWRTLNGQKVLGSFDENPYEQMKKCRGKWMDFLQSRQSEFLTAPGQKTIQRSHVCTYICVTPTLPDKTQNSISKAARWFHLTGLDKIVQAVVQETSREIDLDPQEISKIIKILNLREGDMTFGGTVQVPVGYMKRGGSAPPIPSLMVGRDEALLELKKRIGMSSISGNGSSHRHVQVLTAVRGWPGVGKTTLAAAIAHDSDIPKFFTDGTLWASLGDTPNLLIQLASWCQAVGLDHLAQSTDLGHMSSQLAAHMRDKKMLLIVDDVWDVKHVVPFRVGGVGCRMLITTRSSSIAEQLVGEPGDVYRLDVLATDSALHLLAKLAPTVYGSHPEQCKELVRRLEGLPLAIQVAGRLLQAESKFGWGIDALLEELSEGIKIIEAEAPADRVDVATQTTPTVAVLLKKSTDRLDPKTREYFAYIGAFAPVPAYFDLESLVEVFGIEDPHPIVRALVERGLLEVNKDRFQMHALLAAHAKYLLETEEFDD